MQKEYFNIIIDLSSVHTLEQFHSTLKNVFGFPSFYGKNIHALIDCLSSLRQPEDGMSMFSLPHAQDVLILEIRGLSEKEWIITNNFIIAIEQVNNREIARGLESSIILNLIN